ncbi:MAG TPA: diguanylate cyclase [Acidimicrobiales bacterium]|nr:diguanylate cyclase [Acidimicrobiales bacterium]
MGDPAGQAASDGDAPRRDVSNLFVVGLIRYLERAGGDGLIDEVLAAAGCAVPVGELKKAKWTSREEMVALAEAAASLTGDPEIGRRTGEELFRTVSMNETSAAVFRSAGDPGAALEGLVAYAGKMARGREYRITSRSEGEMVVVGDYVPRQAGHPFFCDLPMGIWTGIPTFYGSTSTATHPSCQCRGDDLCTFVIRWDRATADESAVSTEAEKLRRRLSSYEEVQDTAAELARASDLQSLAERILDAVDAMMPAPSLIVAIKAKDQTDPVLAARGVADDLVRRIAGDLLDGTYNGYKGIALQAPLGQFGIVAALLPQQDPVAGTEARLLGSFARHAAARIESLLSRQEAEDSRQTASALLQLARALSETTTEQEVATELASAIPVLLRADHSVVLRWDAEERTMRPVAFHGSAEDLPYAEVTVDEVPDLLDVAAHPVPVVLRRSEAPEWIADAMTRWGDAVDVVVPLVDQGQFLGMLCAGFRGEPTLDADTAFARLRGAADLGVNAISKARLLEEVRRQALHDPLTGLPNRTLLEERVRHSLAAAKRNHRKVGLLFLDLDRFKAVNDSLGHELGDLLICEAAARMSSILRETDTLARMGGDEFVVVLSGIKTGLDAERVARKILEKFNDPFVLGDRTVSATASIGIAVYPDDGDEYGSLLQSADTSMYTAKAAGRATFARSARG